MESIRNGLDSAVNYAKVFLKWMIFASVVGITGGAVGSIFHISIDCVTELRYEYPWILFLLPFGGLLIVGGYRLFRKKGRIDTNSVIESVQKDKKVPLVMAPLIFFSTLITHFFGGSAGREGAALQLGGSIGYNLGRFFKLNSLDSRIIVMTGMSSVFSALFGTPLTAAFFSIEVISVGIIHYAALVPCLIASVVAAQIASMFGLSPVSFVLNSGLSLSWNTVFGVVALSLLCALVSIVFCYSIKRGDHFFEKYLPNAYVRAFAGGALIVVLTLIVGTSEYNGAGMDVIEKAVSGEAKYEAFALKLLFTVITIASGFKGGEIIPGFFIGSTFGCVAGSILGLDAGVGAAIGCVAVFCGMVNCPFASVILALELFGAEYIILFALACGISFMMSGRFGLYNKQKFFCSKIKEEFYEII